MSINKLISVFVIAIFSFSISQISNAQDSEFSESNWTKRNFKTKFTAEELKGAPVKLIPYPQKVVWSKESQVIHELFVKESDALSPLLIQEINQICSENKIPITNLQDFNLRFSYNEVLPDEAYELSVNKKGISISASSESGFFYALQTLRQLIKNENNICKIQLCHIEDKPQFPIRGFMIDVGRNFQSIELLKKQLDIMAKYKLNTFHWHLTDRPAWRIESKMYPELTDGKNHRPSRNPGKYYTYEEIRDFIKYANDKQINVIPEIDMPGHSDSFIKSMGCRMESPKGMHILENVLKEFFSEIPKELAPILHIGSDEVKIDNPEEFVSKMVNIVESNGRKVIVWSPGLKTSKRVIKQTWEAHKENFEGCSEIDSKFSYINNGEPFSFINNLFFRPIGDNSKNNVLGGIICLWPDVNVWSENDIYQQHPVYSSLLTYAWTSWTADIKSSPNSYQINLPLSNTEASDYFSAFENYLITHKARYFSNSPFPYFAQSEIQWKIIGPFDKDEGNYVIKSDTDTTIYKGKKLKWKEASGGTLTINTRDDHHGHYPEAEAGQTVYAKTYIHSDQETSIKVYINFESPLRANRAYTGIAKNGSWDINGGEIWVNDQILKGPKWENPGWKPFKQTGWAVGIDKEIPWTDEELYWLREPATIHLKKGWNKIYVKIPCAVKSQNWMFTFVPLDMNGIRFSTNSFAQPSVEN